MPQANETTVHKTLRDFITDRVAHNQTGLELRCPHTAYNPIFHEVDQISHSHLPAFPAQHFSNALPVLFGAHQSVHEDQRELLGLGRLLRLLLISIVREVYSIAEMWTNYTHSVNLKSWTAYKFVKKYFNYVFMFLITVLQLYYLGNYLLTCVFILIDCVTLVK